MIARFFKENLKGISIRYRYTLAATKNVFFFTAELLDKKCIKDSLKNIS